MEKGATKQFPAAIIYLQKIELNWKYRNGMELSIYHTSLDSLTGAPDSISLTEGEAMALFVGAAVAFWDSAAWACTGNNVTLIDKVIASLHYPPLT